MISMNSPILFKRAQFFLSLILGVWMMLYGFSKVLQLQFQVGAYYYTLPLGEISEKILTWSFLGHTGWFQTFLGLAELIPALFLFFKRTRLLGALLIFPVLLNVVLINFALNLWSDTKMIGLLLLSLNVTILLFDWPKIKTIAVDILKIDKIDSSSKWFKFERYFSIIVLFIGLYSAYAVVYKGNPSGLSDFVGQRQINKSGSFVVESFLIDGVKIFTDGTAKIYFDVGNRVYLVSKDERIEGAFAANKADKSFSLEQFYVLESNEKIEGQYEVLNENSILIKAKRSDQNIEIKLRKIFSWH